MITQIYSYNGGQGVTTFAALMAARGKFVLSFDNDLPATLGEIVAPITWSQLIVRQEDPVPLFTACNETLVYAADDARPRHMFPNDVMYEAFSNVLAALSASDEEFFVDVPNIGAYRQLLEDVGANTRLLVITEDYLALRASLHASPSGLIVMNDPSRSLSVEDVRTVMNRPVTCTIPVTPAVARTIDAGLLASRIPKQVVAALEKAGF